MSQMKYMRLTKGIPAGLERKVAPYMGDIICNRLYRINFASLTFELSSDLSHGSKDTTFLHFM